MKGCVIGGYCVYSGDHFGCYRASCSVSGDVDSGWLSEVREEGPNWVLVARPSGLSN